jgi:threonine dehydratase
VVGVEPTTGDDAGQSWRQNKIVSLPAVPQTIADGVRTRFIGERNLAVMRQYVAEMLTATDEELLEALHLIWSRLKLVVEPTSALPLAALLNGRLPVTGRRVGIILSGGNVDLKLNLAP